MPSRHTPMDGLDPLQASATDTPSTTIRKQACERCWRRKQKCDKENPVCSNCREAGAICGPRTTSLVMSSGDSSGLIAVGDGYIQTLKRRIKYLEDYHQSKRLRTTDSSATRSSNIQNPTPETQVRGYDDQQTPTSNVSVRDALKDFGHFALNVQNSNRVTHSNAFTMLYFVQLAMSEVPCRMLGKGRTLDSAQYRTYLTQSLELREDDTSKPMSQYMDSVLALYPYILRAELLQYLDIVLQNQSHEATYADGKTAHCFFIVYMALSTGCSNTSKRLEFDLLTFRLWAHASRLGNDIANGHHVKCLISLALCAIHGQGYDKATQIVAMAMARAIALGLHRLRSPSQGRPDHAEVEENRRAFWIIYVLDRLLCSTMGLAYGIEDHDISTPLPELPKDQEEARQNPNFHLVQLIEHARLLSILKRNSHRPRMYFTSLYQSWVDSTPLRPQSTDGSATDLFLRLKCRLLVAIHNAESRSTQPARDYPLDEEDVEDTLSTCLEFLRSLESNYDCDINVRCVTDQYEIASVGVMCSTIQRSLPPVIFDNLCLQIKTLSISLLSYLSATSPAAAQMRKALSALDAENDSRLSGIVEHDQWISLVPRPIREAVAHRISTA